MEGATPTLAWQALYAEDQHGRLRSMGIWGAPGWEGDGLKKVPPFQALQHGVLRGGERGQKGAQLHALSAPQYGVQKFRFGSTPPAPHLLPCPHTCTLRLSAARPPHTLHPRARPQAPPCLA